MPFPVLSWYRMLFLLPMPPVTTLALLRRLRSMVRQGSPVNQDENFGLRTRFFKLIHKVFNKSSKSKIVNMVKVQSRLTFYIMNMLIPFYWNSRTGSHSQFMIMVKKEVGIHQYRMNMRFPIWYRLTANPGKTVIVRYRSCYLNTTGKFVSMGLNGRTR